jgi:uncharacterized delta-60 repeat protein
VSTLKLVATVVTFVAAAALGPSAYATPGDLDATFSGDGLATAAVPGSGFAEAVAVGADGSVVACGHAGGDLAVLRWKKGGHPDTGLGGDGIVVRDFGGTEVCTAVAVLPSGRILAAGRSTPGFVFLARFKPGGALDATFGKQGRKLVPMGANGGVGGLEVLPDGKILVAGNDDTKLMVLRFRASGKLDTTFGGGDGSVRLGARQQDYGYALAVQTDGRILVGGADWNGVGEQYRFLVARFTATGKIDTTFSGNGWTELDWTAGDDEIYGLAVTGSGRIVAAGFASQGPGGNDLAMTRFKPSGGLDTGFGVNGRVQTDFAGGSETARGIVRQGKKILAVGYTAAASGDVVVARYRPGGGLDPTFGGGDGFVITDIAGAFDVGYALARDHGTAVVAGRAGSDLFAARYLLS